MNTVEFARILFSRMNVLYSENKRVNHFVLKPKLVEESWMPAAPPVTPPHNIVWTGQTSLKENWTAPVS